MFTTREVGLDEHNNLVFQEKIDLELSNAKRKQLGLGTTDKEILSIRQAWEQIANTQLKQAGLTERIDHCSYKEQGNGKIAQIHETPQVTAMRRKGKETEISRTNDERKAYNAQISQEPQQEEKEQRQSELLTSVQRAAEAARQAAEQERAREAAEQEKLNEQYQHAYATYSAKKAELGSRGQKAVEFQEKMTYKIISGMEAEDQSAAYIAYWNNMADGMNGLEFRNEFILIPDYSTTELMERYEAVSDWTEPRNRHAVQTEVEKDSWYIQQRQKINDNTKWIETLHQHNQRLEYDYRVEKRHRESTFFGIGAMLRKENSEQKRYNEQYKANNRKIHELKAEKEAMNEAYQNRLRQEVDIEYRHFNKELQNLRQEIAKRPLEEFAAMWAQAKSRMQTVSGLQATDHVLREAEQEQDKAAKRLVLYFGTQQMKETDKAAQKQELRAQQRWERAQSRGRDDDDFGIGM